MILAFMKILLSKDILKRWFFTKRKQKAKKSDLAIRDKLIIEGPKKVQRDKSSFILTLAEVLREAIKRDEVSKSAMVFKLSPKLARKKETNVG